MKSSLARTVATSALSIISARILERAPIETNTSIMQTTTEHQRIHPEEKQAR